jgi:hypothetical protein
MRCGSPERVCHCVWRNALYERHGPRCAARRPAPARTTAVSSTAERTTWLGGEKRWRGIKGAGCRQTARGDSNDLKRSESQTADKGHGNSGPTRGQWGAKRMRRRGRYAGDDEGGGGMMEVGAFAPRVRERLV